MSSKPDIRLSNPFGKTKPSMSSLADGLAEAARRIVPVEQPSEPSMKITRVGLEGEARTREEWDAFGDVLAEIEGGIQWARGDWLCQGERDWGVTYEEAAERWNLDVGTLRNYAYVSSNVNLSLRNDKLTWSHHQVVAQIPNENDQREWLELSAREGWPVARLRREIADETGVKQLGAPPPPTFITPHAADALKKLAKLTPERVAAMDGAQLGQARQQYEMLINAAERVRRAIQEREQALKLEASKRGQW